MGCTRAFLLAVSATCDRRPRYSVARCCGLSSCLMISRQRHTDQAAGPRVLRVWDVLRTQQLEFAYRLTPGLLLYRRQSYDFDPSAVDPAQVQHSSTLRTGWKILTGRYDVLELIEPGQLPAWPQILVNVTAYRVNRAVRRGHPMSVLYAIDNLNVRDDFIARVRLPRSIAGPVFDVIYRYLLGPVDRIVYGTTGAKENYARLAGRTATRIESTLINELDEPCNCGPLDEKDEHLLLFVGAFDERKGIRLLMQVWPHVAVARPDIRFVIVGKGALAGEVEQWARDRPDVDYQPDPPRAQVHAWYRRARVVVLLSQPTLSFREQVGLPITEGLSHGCLICATSQTGVADWLREHGHLVVEHDDAAAHIAEQLVKVFAASMRPADVLADLPTTTTRIQADRWLYRSRVQSPERRLRARIT